MERQQSSRAEQMVVGRRRRGNMVKAQEYYCLFGGCGGGLGVPVVS
jgi:hypothetical protein